MRRFRQPSMQGAQVLERSLPGRNGGMQGASMRWLPVPAPTLDTSISDFSAVSTACTRKQARCRSCCRPAGGGRQRVRLRRAAARRRRRPFQRLPVRPPGGATEPSARRIVHIPALSSCWRASRPQRCVPQRRCSRRRALTAGHAAEGRCGPPGHAAGGHGRRSGSAGRAGHISCCVLACRRLQVHRYRLMDRHCRLRAAPGRLHVL